MSISEQDMYRGLLNTNPEVHTALEYSDADIDVLVAEDIVISYADLCIVAGCTMEGIVRFRRAGIPHEYLTACFAAGRDAEWILAAYAAGIPLEFATA